MLEERPVEGTTVTRDRKDRGFTLIELLVAISLMVILITSTVMIFNSSVATVKISEARINIQNSARAAMDHLWRDLSSMLPMDGGSQRFWMSDDAINPTSAGAGAPMSPTDPNRHVTGATDSIGFRTVTSVNGILLPVQVIYRLVQDLDGMRQRTIQRVINGRIQQGVRIYVLRKEILNLDGTAVRDATSGRPILPIDLCYYVTAFNLEYMHAMSNDRTNPLSGLNGQFCQIAPDMSGQILGPFPGPASTILRPGNLSPIIGARPRNPMGEPDGASDGSSPIKNDIQQTTGTGTRFYPAFIVPALRATMRVVEGSEARQERVYTRVIWLPTG